MCDVIIILAQELVFKILFIEMPYSYYLSYFNFFETHAVVAAQKRFFGECNECIPMFP